MASTNGTYTFAAVGYIDLYGCLYNVPFIPHKPLLNLLTTNHSTSLEKRFQFTANLTTSQSLILVVTSYSVLQTTSFNVTVYGPAQMTFKESRYLKWKRNATTVAGGNREGDQPNQLSYPFSIFVDRKKHILITDHGNDRIVRWEWQANRGTIIAGGNGQGNRTDQLNGPSNVVVDKQNRSIIIADWKNSRVIRWFDQNQTNQQILVDSINCWGLAMDKDEYLYVTDVEKNEVRRWKKGEVQGTLVAGGNGKGDRLNQLNSPRSLFVDDQQSIYLSDNGNHRVMKWRKDAKEGVIVAGGNKRGHELNQLTHPHGVLVDRWGQMYVADFSNHRIMRWREGEREGELVVGESGHGHESNQLSNPTGLSFDDEGHLYVADSWNHRIQKFDLIVD